MFTCSAARAVLQPVESCASQPSTSFARWRWDDHLRKLVNETDQEHGLGMRDVSHGYDIVTVAMAVMSEILAKELHANSIHTTAVPKCQSYTMVIPTTAFHDASKRALPTIPQQDTHQEYYPH